MTRHNLAGGSCEGIKNDPVLLKKAIVRRRGSAIIFRLFTPFEVTMRKIAAICSLLLCAPTGLAQDDESATTESSPSEMAPAAAEEPQAAAEEPQAAAATAPAAIDKRKSRTARGGKKVTVEAGGGLVIGALSGPQFDVLYNMMPDLQLGLMYGSGALDLKSAVGSTTDVEVREASVSGSIVALEALYFIGNSFYTRFGLGQRSIEATIDIHHKKIDYGIAGSIKADSQILLFGIGNQWQFDAGFTIGAEWVGYSQPMSSSSSSSLKEKGSAASATGSEKSDLDKLKKDFEDAAESIGESGSTRLLILSLGWAF
jgi:hypothetical protein